MANLTLLTSILYREEVERARAMTDQDRLLAGPRLFHRACAVMADGIRHAHPDLDDDGVTALLTARLERLRALERS